MIINKKTKTNKQQKQKTTKQPEQKKTKTKNFTDI